MKPSYNNENLHHELILKIKEFIDSLGEFQTTPFHQTETDYQKSFGVLSDNGNFDLMKRFTIIVEDHKTQNQLNQNSITKLLNTKLDSLSVWELIFFKNAIDNNFRKVIVDGEIAIDYHTKWSDFHYECLGCLQENIEQLKEEFTNDRLLTFGDIILLSVNKMLIDKGVELIKKQNHG